MTYLKTYPKVSLWKRLLCSFEILSPAAFISSSIGATIAFASASVILPWRYNARMFAIFDLFCIYPYHTTKNGKV